MPNLIRSTAAALLLLASRAHAQVAVDPAALRPTRFSYELSIVRDGQIQPLGQQTISFTGVTFAGTPSWLILESRDGGGILGLDSVVVTRDALTPLHWGATMGQSRLAAAFARDSVYGATSSPLGKRTIVGPAPRGVIASEGMLDGILQLAPIDDRWVSDVALLVVDLSGSRLLAARLAVEREEEVTVPAGTFATWVVSLRTGNAEKLFWVTKDAQMVVRSSQTLAQLNGAVLDRVLTRVDDLMLLPTPAVPLPGDQAPRPPTGTR
jgi:hypothetical protein